MSRDSRDTEPLAPTPHREEVAQTPPERCSRPPRSWSPSDGLSLPRTDERQPVWVDRERFLLREAETELLSTVGAFRAVPESELLRNDRDHVGSDGGRAAPRAVGLQSLRDQGLTETRTIVINDRPERVVALTPTGRVLLEEYRKPRADDSGPEQQYYAGLVKPRELAHDAQFYRMFQTEREQLEADGARITRVVLDYELKREYHTFVHEQCQDGVDANDARRGFAEAHDLPFVDGHIELPDVRIEYETPYGDQAHRDLELATEHYSSSRVGGKQSAGFRVYRAAGGGGGGTAGGSSFDPHHLEWLR